MQSLNQIPRIIDNEDPNRRLSTLLKNVLSTYKAEKWRFATGFFFFDGWKEIKDVIPDNIKEFYLIFGYTDELLGKIFAEKVLKEVDKKRILKILTRKLLEKFSDEKIEELKNEKKLRDLIEHGIMKIRWIKNLHAKLYLFTRDEDDPVNLDGRAIIGSSNITARGLSESGELNVFLSDPKDIKLLLDWFKRRWIEAEELSGEILLEAIVEESKRRTARKIGFFEPEEFKLTLLDGYLFLIWYFLDGIYDIDRIKEELITAENKFNIKEHNRDPVIWGFQIINDWNGVILADPVGLGKSFQALGILSALRAKGKIEGKDIKKILLVTPPHLIENEQWPDYIKEFYDIIEDKGQDREAANYGIATNRKIFCKDNYGDFEIFIVSSYGLARVSSNSNYIDKLAEYDIIIVDEAHHFKNILAKRRRILQKVIDKHREKYGSNPYVILLTATPILNDVNELLSLISLFSRGETGDFEIIVKKDPTGRIIRIFEEYQDILKELKNATELDKDQLEKLEEKRRECISKIRDFIGRIMIMRSRTYVEKKYFKKTKIERPKLKALSYSLGNEKELIELIDKLYLAYLDLAPSDYVVIPAVRVKKNRLEAEIEGVSLHAIMKILLAKRLESSVYAFLKSLTKVYAKTKALLSLLEDFQGDNIDEIAKKIGNILHAKDLQTIEEELSKTGIEIRDIEESERIERIKEFLLNPKKLKELRQRLRKDLELIESVLGSMLENQYKLYELIRKKNYMSKEKRLLKLIRKIMSEGKQVIIFSMYKDTVKYLKEFLEEELNLSDKKIFVITGETKRKGSVIAEYREVGEEEGFSILIATDSISEGINLEFVDYLINYDIPWVPSIIMQRVGRLWRITREKGLIFYNFLPPEDLVGQFSTIIEKVEEKIKILRELLIHEIKLLKEEEELTEDFETRVYGEVYKSLEKEDINVILSQIAKGELEEGFKQYLLNLVNSKPPEFNKSISELIREREEIFKEMYKEITNGKILNLYFDGSNTKPISVFRFGKLYWGAHKDGSFRIRIIMKEQDMINLFQEKWNYVMKHKDMPIIYRYQIYSEEQKAKTITYFKNELKLQIMESFRKVRAPSWDREILSNLVSPLEISGAITIEQEEKIRKTREELFFISLYYLENKKRSKMRIIYRRELEKLGIINKKGKINGNKLRDYQILKKLREKLKGAYEDPRLEVIF